MVVWAFHSPGMWRRFSRLAHHSNKALSFTTKIPYLFIVFLCLVYFNTNMACAGESDPLDDQVIADCAAELYAVAEEAALIEKPLYICTEVPPQEAQHELQTVEITSQAAAKKAIEVHRQAFPHGGGWLR
jgi:tagatose-1,6-bisphosphate aldolase non-catalytic subunit AgaZ/GatZ